MINPNDFGDPLTFHQKFDNCCEVSRQPLDGLPLLAAADFTFSPFVFLTLVHSPVLFFPHLSDTLTLMSFSLSLSSPPLQLKMETTGG